MVFSLSSRILRLERYLSSLLASSNFDKRRGYLDEGLVGFEVLVAELGDGVEQLLSLCPLDPHGLVIDDGPGLL